MSLDKFHLTHDSKSEKWRLEREGSDRATRVFDTKTEATRGGVLRDAIGNAGGSVRVHNMNGRIQEERTFPRSKDPKSKG